MVERSSSHKAHLLEKDIRVVATLGILFKAPFAEHLTIKGGTSLSKMWRAIRRFFEDVDITCDVRAFAPDLVSGFCDEAQGEPLSVLWEHEIDACILEDGGWSAVADKGFDDPALFAAYLHTLSWNCVTATDSDLFQAPFRAGIRIDAYQLDPLRKALWLPPSTCSLPTTLGSVRPSKPG